MHMRSVIGVGGIGLLAVGVDMTSGANSEIHFEATLTSESTRQWINTASGSWQTGGN